VTATEQRADVVFAKRKPVHLETARVNAACTPTKRFKQQHSITSTTAVAQLC